MAQSVRNARMGSIRPARHAGIDLCGCCHATRNMHTKAKMSRSVAMTRELEARQESRQQKRDANARTRSDQRGSQTLRQNPPDTVN